MQQQFHYETDWFGATTLLSHSTRKTTIRTLSWIFGFRIPLPIDSLKSYTESPPTNSSFEEMEWLTSTQKLTDILQPGFYKTTKRTPLGSIESQYFMQQFLCIATTRQPKTFNLYKWSQTRFYSFKLYIHNQFRKQFGLQFFDSNFHECIKRYGSHVSDTRELLLVQQWNVHLYHNTWPTLIADSCSFEEQVEPAANTNNFLLINMNSSPLSWGLTRFSLLSKDELHIQSLFIETVDGGTLWCVNREVKHCSFVFRTSDQIMLGLTIHHHRYRLLMLPPFLKNSQSDHC